MFKIKNIILSISIIFSSLNYANANNQVFTGLDILEKNNFSILKGKNVGLITNHSAFNKDGEYILDIFSKQKEFKLKAIFSPEHGLRGKEDKEFIPSEVYGEDIPVHSLYGDNKKPTDEMLKGIDILIYDIQDIGTRFYTFITTMAYAMEVAEKNNIQFIVLDRPNPITGNIIEGDVLDLKFRSFTGYFPIPTRYGMTVGELAKYYVGENKMKLDLKIVEMENWKRNMWFDQTGLKWINPSPNMRSLESALIYPGLGVLETTNFSVGRGTDNPFMIYGSPWLENINLVNYLNNKNIEGIKFESIEFIPDSSVFSKQINKGFKINITNRDKVKSTNALIYITEYLSKNQKGMLKPNKNDGIRRSFGSEIILELLEGKIKSDFAINKIEKNIEKFKPIREKYLIY